MAFGMCSTPPVSATLNEINCNWKYSLTTKNIQT